MPSTHKRHNIPFSFLFVLLLLTSCTGRSDHWLSLLEQAEEMNRND